MFCRNCGNELLDDAVFCDNCGTKVEIIKKENIHPVYDGAEQSFESENVRKDGKTKTVSVGKIAACIGVICLMAAIIVGAVFLIKANKRKNMREFPWLGIRMDLPEYWDSVINFTDPFYSDSGRRYVFVSQEIKSYPDIYDIIMNDSPDSFILLEGEASEETFYMCAGLFAEFIDPGENNIDYDTVIQNLTLMEPKSFIEYFREAIENAQIQNVASGVAEYLSDISEFTSDDKEIQWLSFKVNYHRYMYEDEMNINLMYSFGLDGENLYFCMLICNDDDSETYSEIKTALETLEYDPELLASDEYLESEIEGRKEIYKPILISEDISSANQLATAILASWASETVWDEFPEDEQRFLITSYDDLGSGISEAFADTLKATFGSHLPKIKYTYEGASYFGVECNITENNLKVYICDGMDDSGEFINPIEAYPTVSEELVQEKEQDSNTVTDIKSDDSGELTNPQETDSNVSEELRQEEEQDSDKVIDTESGVVDACQTIAFAIYHASAFHELQNGEQRFLLTSYDDLEGRFSETFVDTAKGVLEENLPNISDYQNGGKYFGVVVNKTEYEFTVKVYICDGMDDNGEFINPIEAYPTVSEELTDE